MLNGMPTQMLTSVTAINDVFVLTSQGTGWLIRCRCSSSWLSTPESLSNIHRQTVPDTTSGSSQGTSSSERSTPPSGKTRRKNSASARPIENWKTSDPAVNRTVLTTVGQNT